MNDVRMPLGVSLVQLPKNVDERGVLSFLEGGHDIPFDVQRVFWISQVPSGKVRGGHAHWTCHEVLFPVSGSFEVEVDDGLRSQTFLLDQTNVGLLIPAGVWCELRHFSEDAVCVVVASQPYDPAGYAHAKTEWSRILREKQGENCGNDLGDCR